MPFPGDRLPPSCIYVSKPSSIGGESPSRPISRRPNTQGHDDHTDAGLRQGEGQTVKPWSTRFIGSLLGLSLGLSPGRIRCHPSKCIPFACHIADDSTKITLRWRWKPHSINGRRGRGHSLGDRRWSFTRLVLPRDGEVLHVRDEYGEGSESCDDWPI